MMTACTNDIKEDTDLQINALKQRIRMDSLDTFESMKIESCPRKETLKQFRKNLEDILTPDVSDRRLLKFLRARSYNLAKCESMYRLDFFARQMFKPDELAYTFEKPEVLKKYEFANYLGIAKDGTPIRYIAMGRGDMKGFILSLDVYDIAKYCTSEIEKDMQKCKEQSAKLGREIDQVTYVIDMDSFSLGQAFFSGSTELGFDLFSMLQDFYPEIWSNILIVNAPFYFQTAFNLFKPIFRHTILRKVHVVSRENTANLLLRFIDAEVLPVFLGGTRLDSSGDPMCSEFMRFGGTVPEEYYLRNRVPLNPADIDVEDVWVSARSCYNIVVVVREPNSIIRVEMRSEGGSLPSAIYFRELGPDPENPDIPGRDERLDPSDKSCNVVQCSPFTHLQTHFSPVDNYCYAPRPGIYIFRFFNNYNWLTSRRIIYRIRVLPPGTAL